MCSKRGGTSFIDLDGAGDTLLDDLLAQVVYWNGQYFDLAGATANNVVAATGQTIALPYGQYSMLYILATTVGGTAQNATLKINYAGNFTQTLSQTFSDWANGYSGPGTTAPNESIAKVMAQYDSSTGTQTGNRYVYAYAIPLFNTMPIQSITLPDDSNIKILAMNLAH